MKRFQFPVEKVRLWRDQQAQMEELKLQQLHAELHRFITQQQDLQNEANRAELAVKQGGPIAADELARLDDFKRYVRACTRKLDEQRRQLEAKIVLQQQALVEARRKVELLNRLKELAFSKWISTRDKEQEELSSELFLAKRKNLKTSLNC